MGLQQPAFGSIRQGPERRVLGGRREQGITRRPVWSPEWYNSTWQAGRSLFCHEVYHRARLPIPFFASEVT